MQQCSSFLAMEAIAILSVVLREHRAGCRSHPPSCPFVEMFFAHKLKFDTLDKESNMSTLWRREEFLRICCKEELAEKAQDIEVTIPVKKSQETRYNLDPGSFFVNCSWGRRPDVVAINEALKIVYILKFKRSTDRGEGFLDIAHLRMSHGKTMNDGIMARLRIGNGTLLHDFCAVASCRYIYEHVYI